MEALGACRMRAVAFPRAWPIITSLKHDSVIPSAMRARKRELDRGHKERHEDHHDPRVHALWHGEQYLRPELVSRSGQRGARLASALSGAGPARLRLRRQSR